MNKLRYIYGLLILVILLGGFLTAKANGLFPSESELSPTSTIGAYDDLTEIAGKGLGVEKRGVHTIRELIVAYNLTKEDFYQTLLIPSDQPDTATIIDLIKDGVVTSKQVQAYMIPITENFGK